GCLVPIGAAARVPARLLGDRFENGASAWILQVAQAKLERIDAGGRSELVHERLDGEYIDVSAERTQCRDANGHCLQGVVDDAVIGEAVARHRIALTGATRRKRQVDRRRG